jgi:hypothetical protein
MSMITRFALAQVGKPYKFRRSGPDAFDCSGLTKRAVAQIGLDWYHGATTQWLRGKQTTAPPERYGYFGETGGIDALPMDKVAFLFAQDASTGKMAHVGIYAGNGWVVQAGGYGGRGVHYNRLDRRRWTHYAVLTSFWTERDGDENMDSVTLRRGSIGPQVVEMQKALLALGYSVGAKTKADGKFGPATEAAVKAFQKDYGLPVTGTWGLPENQALDKDLEDEVGPPANDDTITVPRAWYERLVALVGEVG